MKFRILCPLIVLVLLISAFGKTDDHDNKKVVKLFKDCPENIEVQVVGGQKGAVVDFNVPKETVEYTVRQIEGLAPRDTFPVGTITNTYVATNKLGDTDTCRFEIVIVASSKEVPFALQSGVPTPVGKVWKPVQALTDEFAGAALDETKWNIDPQGHSELNWTGRLPAIFQRESFGWENGHLTIEAGQLPEPVTISPYGSPMTYKYYGGILRSRVTSTIGNYYECRMKMNKTEMGGGFWLCHKGVCGKKHEIDITESVGCLTELTHDWAKRWDQIMHSNTILRKTQCNEEERSQGAAYPSQKNHEKFFVYGFWWKSATELLFYLDGEHIYTVTPPVPFDENLFMQFSIEAYDWNPIPETGSQVATASLADRTTYIDYIRTFQLVDE
ncbi:MAG: HYR domain-containing protein [Bacteroidota bacterium]